MCLLLVLLTVVPFVEFLLLIEVSKHIGIPETFVLIIFTGVFGAILARIEGLKTLQNINKEISRGEMPGRKLLDGLLILIGGILLITPGIITDIIGLSAILPFSRILFREFLVYTFKHKINLYKNVTIASVDYANNIQDDSDKDDAITVYPENKD